jgi:ATP-dependent DNA helicase RecG
MGATLDDLDMESFLNGYLPLAIASEVLAENQRMPEEQFASLHFLSREKVPNVAAILVFGKDPTRWIPGAYVQFLRLDGPELTDPIRHQEEIKGPLPELIRQIDKVLAANISITTDVRNGPTEERQPDYPIVALQQISRNAVLHRTYESTNAPSRIYWFSDRIEIISPGGLYGLVNADNFGQPGATDYRNPLLAEAMKVLGFVQRFGIGIPLARQELQKNGNPAPEFKLDTTRISVTIRSKS